MEIAFRNIIFLNKLAKGTPPVFLFFSLLSVSFSLFLSSVCLSFSYSLSCSVACFCKYLPTSIVVTLLSSGGITLGHSGRSNLSYVYPFSPGHIVRPIQCNPSLIARRINAIRWSLPLVALLSLRSSSLRLSLRAHTYYALYAHIVRTYRLRDEPGSIIPADEDLFVST